MSTLSIILVAALSGGMITGGTMYAIDKRNQQQEDDTAEVVQAIASMKSDLDESILVATQNTTDLDILSIPCSSEYIDGVRSVEGEWAKTPHGDLLCREMYCYIQTRGMDGAASQKQCESISNLSNSLVILKACEGKDAGAYQACMHVFEKRK